MAESVIVFGANGFVGRHLVRTLAEQGQPVIALVRTRLDLLKPGVEVHRGTFEHPDAFAPLLARARAVVHVASCSTPGGTAGKPLEELEANLRPTLALLQALQDKPHCELLYLSSGGTLYGESQQPVNERDIIRPRSYYGAGKAAAEHFIHAGAMQFSLAATVLRPSNLYGPGQGVRNGFGIIPTALQHISNNKPLTIWGDGSSIRDFLYIDDFIRLCLAITDQPMPRGSRTFNAASGQGVSLNRLIDTIRRVTKAPLPVINEVRRAVDVAHITLDPTLAAGEYGWATQVSLEEGLERTWAWWQSQHAQSAHFIHIDDG